MGYNNIIESGRKEYEAKVKNLENYYSKIVIVDGLFQDGFIGNDKYNKICQRIVNHLNRD